MGGGLSRRGRFNTRGTQALAESLQRALPGGPCLLARGGFAKDGGTRKFGVFEPIYAEHLRRLLALCLTGSRDAGAGPEGIVHQDESGELYGGVGDVGCGP